MFRRGTIAADASAGVAVALVALPLSIAIANASGVGAEVGLVTAVVGGLVVAVFGGCRLQVSGPGNTTMFLVAEVVAKYGLPGLAWAMLIGAALQILAGALRLGRFMQLIPRPVIAGFLSGIGLTILFTQLPVALGYQVSRTEEGGAPALLWETLRQLGRAEPTAVVVALVAAGTMLGLPRVSRRLPAPLIALAAASILPAALGWSGVPRLGDMPTRLPWPGLPAVPWGSWNELVLAALALFVMGSLESLLSASVVDSLAEGHRTDHDQELVGQGLGNLASAFLGGIPVSGVIARSATNIQAGARTRLAAVVHALTLLALMFALAPAVGRIPLAALAGVLIAVALRMVEVRMLRALWRGSRAEAAVFLATAGAILATDLIVGVPVGMIAAFAYVIHQMSRLEVRPVELAGVEPPSPGDEPDHCGAVRVIRVEGPLFFASSFHLKNAIRRLEPHRCSVLDLDRVPFLDATGLGALDEVVGLLRRRGAEVLLARPSAAVARRLRGPSGAEFPGLRDCPVYDDLRDAMLHAASAVGPRDLCPACRPEGRCAALGRALEGLEQLDRTPLPRVRAVVARGPAPASAPGGPAVRGTPTPLGALVADSLRPGPCTSWNRHPGRPTVSPSAFVDPLASVIGEVTVGDDVYIGPGVSVRADEGAPFFIGAESNLQDGVTLHGLKGKVVLVEGRAYAIYVGRNACLTHHALVHGPCYLGDRCFVGFKATVHDAVVGEGCVIGLGAVVVGVSLPPGRYVGHNLVIQTQEQADALPAVPPDWERLRDEVVEVNRELAAGHREALRRAPDEAAPSPADPSPPALVNGRA
jgi:MFS superfamily sulfate permease-like transporter/carbonic anhydrase/acetyltransferase-like protein (isoleucine patch superfamily)